jgi:hypothetical protein
MKKIFLLSLFLTSYLFNFSQDLPTARVDVRNGIAVFVMCEPISSYEATKRLRASRSRTTKRPANYIPGTQGNVALSSIGYFTGIDESIETLTRKAVRRRKKMNGYITYDCRQAQGIMFDFSIPLDQKVLARPATISGKHIYIKSTPIRPFKEVETVQLNVKNRIVSPISPSDNLETIVSKIIKESDIEMREYDAIMSSDGLSFKLIKYE